MPRDAASGVQVSSQSATQDGGARVAPLRRDRESRSAPPVYRVEDQIGFLLRRAHQRATSLFQSLIGDKAITPTQYSSLVTLLEHGELSQNRLGRLVAMDKATAQGVVRRLKARSLVVSRPDPGDARRTLIKLTAVGRKLVDLLIANGPIVSQETLKPLGAAERRMLLDLLRRIG